MTREQSIAYATLGKTSRHILALAVDAAARNGAPAALSYDALQAAGCNRAHIASSTRELASLGFVDVRRAQIFTLSDRWRSIASAAEARELAVAARRPVKSRAPRPPSPARVDPKPVQDRPTADDEQHQQLQHRPITLPKLPWPTTYPTRAWDAGNDKP
ncbi:hypothetical protein [Bradyrhizobium sp. LMTR 3]|uniref:hypothetical protein n=1 Tax=Bradyrhizobium sp. LMTR 3 TaxID=189873 RepID=UPI001146A324|nr:hypothetical protein [Bradyrhizobium sp. LMTR 3]